MNPLAEQLNQEIAQSNPQLLEMLSGIGRQLFFPKGILSQSAEAKEKAHRINATIGIAKQQGGIMRFDTVMNSIDGIPASEALTYAPSFGLPALREKWREQLYVKNPSLDGKKISLPVVTCGVTHGVSIFSDIWLDPGDVVILPDLMWGNYNMILNVRKGARLRQYDLFDADGRYNLSSFAKAIEEEARQSRKIAVMLNFPQNPTGYTISEKEADAVVRLLVETAEAGTHVIAVTDDAYFGLFYEAQCLKESLFARLGGRHPNLLAIKLDGGTKEHYIWGLRIGFVTYAASCTGDPEPLYAALEKKTAGCVRGNISNASHLSQSIMLRSLQDPCNQAEKDEKFAILKARALKIKQVLENPKYDAAWDAYPFNSGYFMCIKLKTVEAEPLRVHLLERYGVGLISMGKEALRIAFSCIEEDQVQELFDIVLQGVRDLEAAS
jgi:aspartate/methionine/tyrosine aminotransferase